MRPASNGGQATPRPIPSVRAVGLLFVALGQREPRRGGMRVGCAPTATAMRFGACAALAVRAASPVPP